MVRAINGGFDLLEAKCNHCERVSLVPLRALPQPAETPIRKLEAALYCEQCSKGRQQAPARAYSRAYLRAAGARTAEEAR
jgi:hypothetical protein